MSKKNWMCEVCGDIFKLKRELVEHAKDEVENCYQELSIAEGQLEDLGVKTYDLA